MLNIAKFGTSYIDSCKHPEVVPRCQGARLNGGEGVE